MSIYDLPISFVLKLQRQKLAAEKAGDTNAIATLAKQYPEMFTGEFNDFMDEIKATAIYIDQKHDENFTDLIQPRHEEIKLH